MEISRITPFPVTPTTDVKVPQSPTTAVNQAGKSFSQILNSLNESQTNSDDLLKQLATGGNVDVHEVVLATEENDINFRVALAIRDRLVDAYREVMRMTV